MTQFESSHRALTKCELRAVRRPHRPVTGSIGRDLREHRAIEVVKVQIVIGSFDLDGERLVVGREPRMKVGSLRQPDRSCVAIAVYPKKSSCASIANPGHVGKIATGGHII